METIIKEIYICHKNQVKASTDGMTLNKVKFNTEVNLKRIIWMVLQSYVSKMVNLIKEK